MHKNILAVYNGYLQRQAGDPLSPRYYHSALCHDSFKELDFKDIKQYFKAAEKISCITPEMKSYFPQTAKGKQRVRHIFSTFLLGIYCYDNINNLQDSIKNFIQHKIWTTEENSNNLQTEVRRDFLYLWFLIALYHDMGYPYEDCKRLRKNNLPKISYINKMGQPDSYNYPCAAGIPAPLAQYAQKYFKTRVKTKKLGKRRLDHGFAGGTMLYKNLKKLHNTGNETRPIGTNALQFGPHIFNRYNIPCAWTILCHNIWTAFSGRRKADVYRDCGLEGLIFEENNSPINFREHPLLFLLDFVDTIDPIKRFDHNMYENIVLSSTATEMSLAFSCKVDCNAECNCWSRIRKIQKISDDLAFLKSSQFEARMSGAQITFSFNNIPSVLNTKQ